VRVLDLSRFCATLVLSACVDRFQIDFVVASLIAFTAVLVLFSVYNSILHGFAASDFSALHSVRDAFNFAAVGCGWQNTWQLPLEGPVSAEAQARLLGVPAKTLGV